MIIEKNPDDGTFRYSGYAVDAVQYLAQAFNFTYVIIEYIFIPTAEIWINYYISYTFVNAPDKDVALMGV